MNPNRSVRRFAASVSILAFAAAAPAWAQDSSSEGGIAEIIVTAQKREQSIQDVPVAVTAVSQETLQANRVVNVMDLNGLAPGLMTRMNAGGNASPSYSMRGVFASASDPAQDRQVATYIDGVYIGGVRGSAFDLPDIERIEVLRGPQGTLFGRNATAGAVSIATRDPSGVLKMRQEVTVGNLSQLRTRTTVDTPQLGILSGFVTYVHDERRGDVRNTGAGTRFDYRSPLHNIVGLTKSAKWLGSKNAESVLAALKLEPSDSFSATYKFDWMENDSTPEARVPLYLSSSFTPFVTYQDSTPLYGQFLMPTESKRPKAVNNAWAAPSFNKASGHNLTLNWQATDSLSFKNVASYRSTESLALSSIMGFEGLEVTPIISSFPGFGTRLGQMIVGYAGVNYGKYSQFSNELQANYESDLVTLTAGAMYFRSKELSSGLPGSPTNFGLFVGQLSYNPDQAYPLGGVQEKHHRTRSLAAYGQAEFHLTEQLDAVIGVRLTKDKKRAKLVTGGTYSAAQNSISGTTVTVTPFEKTKPTYSLGLNYKVNDDVLVFAKYSTAYLSGGASGPLVFLPETVKSWEAGLKSEWLDRRLRFNMALYHATYNNAQAAQSGSVVRPANGECSAIGDATCSEYGVVVISNGKVRAKGVELELTAAPVDGLTLGGSYSYGDVKWLNPTAVLTGGRPVAPSGVAKVMAGVNAQYVTPPLFGEATAMFRIDANYQGKYRNTPFLDVATNTTAPQTTPAQARFGFSPSRWIMNARAAVRDIAMGPATAELGVWARNLTNNRDAAYTLFFGNANVNASYQQARTFGVDLIVTFGGN